ncbi:hypothetical protein MLZ73_23750, partial [Escherichia coli]|nr:hypothetical protein [Escherichia coli]
MKPVNLTSMPVCIARWYQRALLRDCVHEYLGKSYFSTVSFFCSLICLLTSHPELTISLSILSFINCACQDMTNLFHGLRKTFL